MPFLTEQEKEELDKLIKAVGCLWPEPYSEDTPEAAFRFLTECCWTYNEADAEQNTIPALDYIKLFVNEWWECRKTGRTLIVEKSRRLIMSWACRGLSLWSMGLKQEKRTIAGLNYSKAAEHVWRIWWLYDQLVKHRPEWKLRPCTPRGGSTAAQELEQVILPNGSLIESLNQEGQSFQGSGYSGVEMEEFSLFRRASYMYGQALRVTEGQPGKPGGHIVIITNSYPNLEWQEIKGFKHPSGP